MKRTNDLESITNVAPSLIRGGVMFVFFFVVFFSCTPIKKKTEVQEYNPDSTYTMLTKDVYSLISDSGITRYLLKAPSWYVYSKSEDPYWYFPEGLYVEQFDSLFQTQGSLKADTGYYYTKRGLWRIVKNVHINSLEGDSFDTQELFWDQEKHELYSDSLVRVRQDEQIIMGYGFLSDERFSKYEVLNISAVIPIEERETVQAEDSSVEKRRKEQQMKLKAVSQIEPSDTLMKIQKK